jgi:hypothetical protein
VDKLEEKGRPEGVERGCALVEWGDIPWPKIREAEAPSERPRDRRKKERRVNFISSVCTSALYPGWRDPAHALDTRGGAQYKAKENVYQTILDPRRHCTLTSLVEDTSTPDFPLPCRAKLFR